MHLARQAPGNPLPTETGRNQHLLPRDEKGARHAGRGQAWGSDDPGGRCRARGRRLSARALRTKRYRRRGPAPRARRRPGSATAALRRGRPRRLPRRSIRLRATTANAASIRAREPRRDRSALIGAAPANGSAPRTDRPPRRSPARAAPTAILFASSVCDVIAHCLVVPRPGRTRAPPRRRARPRSSCGCSGSSRAPLRSRRRARADGGRFCFAARDARRLRLLRHDREEDRGPVRARRTGRSPVRHS